MPGRGWAGNPGMRTRAPKRGFKEGGGSVRAPKRVYEGGGQ